MSRRRQSVLTLRGLVVAAVTVAAWLPAGGGAWLVHHDAVNYRLRESGFRWLTDQAEVVHFIGPIPFLASGFALGIVLLFVLPPWRKPSNTLS